MFGCESAELGSQPPAVAAWPRPNHPGLAYSGDGDAAPQADNNNLAECAAAGQVFSGIRFLEQTACGGSGKFKYKLECREAVSTPTAQCGEQRTMCADQGADAHLWRLDKHHVACPTGTALAAFRFRKCTNADAADYGYLGGANEYQYVFSCCPVQGLGVCAKEETAWDEVGTGSTLDFLGRHALVCPEDHALKSFLLESKV